MNIRHFFGVKKGKDKKVVKSDAIETMAKDGNIDDLAQIETIPETIKQTEYIGHEEVEIIDDPDELNTFMVGKYNMYKMMLKKQRKNYQIIIKHQNKFEKIKFNLSWLKSPFGVEEYAKKEIVNLEFTNHLKNNLSYNNFTIVKQIDDAFSKLNLKNAEIDRFIYVPTDLLKTIDKLYYSPLIKLRPDGYDPLVRLHLKKIKNTITTKAYRKKDAHNLEEISVYEIKGHLVEVELEISSLWISGDSFGVILVANKIVVIGN